MSETKTKIEVLFYNKALRLLSYRPQSKQEITIKLKRFAYRKKIENPGKTISKVVEFIDDLDFAKWWVGQRTEFSPRGKTIIIKELKSKGVDEDIIDSAISFFWTDEVDSLGVKRKAVSEIELAKRAANKKTREYSKLSAALDFERKMIRYLLRRGFDYEISRKVSKRLKENHYG